MIPSLGLITLLFMMTSSNPAGGPDPFPPVQHEATRQMLRCLKPLLQAISVDPALIRRSRVYPIDLDAWYTNRWKLVPPEYARRMIDRTPVPRDVYYIPDTPLYGLYPQWYFYLFNLITTHFKHQMEWDNGYAETLATLVATWVLGPCILKDSIWDTLSETLVLDKPEFHPAYPGLLTYAVLYFYEHGKNVPMLLKAAQQWYRNPKELKKMKVHREEYRQRLRHALFRQFFKVDEPESEPVPVFDHISGFLSLHRSYPAFNVPEPGVDNVEAYLATDKRPPDSRTFVVGLPARVWTFIPRSGDRGISREEVQHAIDLLLKRPPDYWGYWGLVKAMPKPFYDDLIDRLRAGGVTPVLCNDRDKRTVPWVQLTHRGKRITLTHLGNMPYVGDPDIIFAFVHIGFRLSVQLTDPEECVLKAYRQTRPDYLIISGYLSPPQIARLMKQIPSRTIVINWEAIPTFFLKKITHGTFRPVFRIRNWIFTEHYHIGFEIENGKLRWKGLK